MKKAGETMAGCLGRRIILVTVFPETAQQTAYRITSLGYLPDRHLTYHGEPERQLRRHRRQAQPRRLRLPNLHRVLRRQLHLLSLVLARRQLLAQAEL